MKCFWKTRLLAFTVPGLLMFGCGHTAPNSANVSNGDRGSRPADAADATETTPWQSGSRLRARVRDGGDGAALFVTWVDTSLEFDCAFLKTTDDSLRCVPPGGGSNDTFFADAECTQPVSALSNLSILDIPPPPNPDENGRKIFYRVTSDPCADAPFADVSFKVQETKGDPRLMVPFARTGGACGPFTNPLGVQMQGWVAEVVDADLAQFVAATETREPSTEPLVVRVLRGSDGSRENAGLFDTVHTTPCLPIANQADGSSVTTCVRPDVALGGDQDCLVLSTSGACAACPVTSVSISIPNMLGQNPACDLEFETFSVPPLDGSMACPVDLNAAPMCAKVAIRDDTYPKAGIKRMGTGVLRVDLFTDSMARPMRNVAPSPTGMLHQFGIDDAKLGFFDTTLQTSCLPQEDGPAVGRCLPTRIMMAVDWMPTAVGNVVGFSDSDCTTPIYEAVGPLPRTCDGKPWVGTPDGRLYPIGSVLQLDKVYVRDSSACIEDSGGGALRTTLVYYSLGDPSMMSTLPPVMDRVE